ncbi:hypothetical protein DDZ13_14905 [Coraliomargarita sinensis]|uniref:Uncharacterized protein n=1 Tax=Coraliomargarita sinensis TaxID=2174842 RepID=A0A317ZCL0_9BACT|nr:hypothetical protein [Coraliomargarita sinensis]PXA02876.1 hypothetical protein DDZ13_14905 [Coraliomargarita sinensis]
MGKKFMAYLLFLIPLLGIGKEEMQTEVFEIPKDFLALPKFEEDKNEGIEISIAQIAGASTRDILLVFKNTSKENQRILRPLDGSTRNAYYPHYDIHLVSTSSMEPVERIGGCMPYGLWADRKWPEEYLIEIAPNKSKTVKLRLPYEFKDSESYALFFQYRMSEEILREEKALRDTKLNWYRYPQNIWTGTVTAKPTILNGKP